MIVKLTVRLVHPHPDTNGRMERLLMNAMLALGGYTWTVVRIDDRTAYLAAPNRASIDTDIAPFAEFIAERVRWSCSNPRESRHRDVNTVGSSY
jgi:Fic family protein